MQARRTSARLLDVTVVITLNLTDRKHSHQPHKQQCPSPAAVVNLWCEVHNFIEVSLWSATVYHGLWRSQCSRPKQQRGHVNREDIPLRRNHCEVFLGYSGICLTVAKVWKGKTLSGFSKTDMMHSRYKDNGLKCSRVLWGWVYINLRDKIFCCVLFG